MGHKSPHPIGLNEVNWLRKRKLREEIQHYESSEKIAAAPGRKRIETAAPSWKGVSECGS